MKTIGLARRHGRIRLAALEERNRIARDLHDLVIQRLYATGLMLDGLIQSTDSPDVTSRLTAAVTQIEGAIDDIRRTISGLDTRATAECATAEIQQVVARTVVGPDLQAHLATQGPVEEVVVGEVREHLLAVLSESLSNVVRHARARRVDVLLEVTDDISLRVRDDGAGLAGTGIGRGLANIRTRATLLGGHASARDRADGGTELRWVVPRRAW